MISTAGEDFAALREKLNNLQIETLFDQTGDCANLGTMDELWPDRESI